MDIEKEYKEYLGNEIVRSVACWCVEELWGDKSRVVSWGPKWQIWAI